MSSNARSPTNAPTSPPSPNAAPSHRKHDPQRPPTDPNSSSDGSTSAELRRVKGLERRRARQQVEEAGEELAAAQARQQNVEAAALPNTKLFGDTDVEVRVLRTHFKDVERERRTALGSKDINSLDHLPNALCQWRRWAEGRPVTADAIVRVVEVLYAQRVIGPADVDTLVHPLVAWAEHRGIDTKRAIQQALVERGPELDIGL